MNISLVVFLLTLGLVARVSHLLVDDLITQPLRTLVAKLAWEGLGVGYVNGKAVEQTLKNKIFQKLSELLSCVHCVSVWVAAVAILVADAHGESKAYQLVAGAATLSWLTGLLATWRYSKEHED